MGCSQPKEFRTGLRIVGSFLNVKLYYNICGTQGLLRLGDRRGLRASHGRGAGGFYALSNLLDDTKLTPHKPSLSSCAWLCHQSALLPGAFFYYPTFDFQRAIKLLHVTLYTDMKGLGYV